LKKVPKNRGQRAPKKQKKKKKKKKKTPTTTQKNPKGLLQPQKKKPRGERVPGEKKKMHVMEHLNSSARRFNLVAKFEK